MRNERRQKPSHANAAGKFMLTIANGESSVGDGDGQKSVEYGEKEKEEDTLDNQKLCRKTPFRFCDTLLR